jgi:hypothetical protein
MYNIVRGADFLHNPTAIQAHRSRVLRHVPSHFRHELSYTEFTTSRPSRILSELAVQIDAGPMH